MRKTLISVIGPTAIGKTALAIALAQHFQTEIISADSRQFFKEMKIGTAVPSKHELNSAPHHFIQHKSIHESYSVGEFEKEALLRLEKLFAENDIVVMVGGSGLYIDAVTKGLDNFPVIAPEIRTSLTADLQEHGISYLQEELKKIDLSYYNKVDLENSRRLIRALEVCIQSGKPYSSFIGQEKTKRPFHTYTVGITADREVIYNRINTRVDAMLENGLLEEAKSVYEHQGLNALQTVGYKELFNYFSNEWTLDFAIAEIKKNTRRFAKRQLTWFRKNDAALWVNFQDETAQTIQKIEQQISTNE